MKLFTLFLYRLFTPVNLSKIITIFVIGFLSRILIYHFLDINVFFDYLNPISIGYYSFLACFIVFINELFTFFNINLIPNFVISLFTNLSIPFKFLYNHFHYLSISFIRKTFREAFTYFKDKDNNFIFDKLYFNSINHKLYTNYFKTKLDSNSLDPLLPTKTIKFNLSDNIGTNSNQTPLNNNDKKIGINIYNRFRCKIYWIFIENRKIYFVDYKEYQQRWNPNVNLSYELKHKLYLHKETLKWFLTINRRK